MATTVRLFAVSPKKPVKQANTPLKNKNKCLNRGMPLQSGLEINGFVHREKTFPLLYQRKNSSLRTEAEDLYWKQSFMSKPKENLVHAGLLSREFGRDCSYLLFS